MSNLSFAQTYILASKVRSKLTKEAANPKSSLRNLVTQANMLDNLMDYITEETEKRSKTSTVKFDITARNSRTTTTHTSTLVKEIELDEDESEDDSEDEYDEDYAVLDEQEVDEEESSSDDDDYYYYSDEEEPESEELISKIPTPSYKQLPFIDLSLSNIPEEDEETSQVPELSHSRSLSDSESEDSEDDEHHLRTTVLEPSNLNLNLHSLDSKQFQQKHHEIFTINHPTSHQRNSAIYSIESVF
ncbi:uncharacterized protein RJT21DRAFT_117776 [Scheffersomyces amazonensis]|uniref:uncharacterized protein n=1 Tax=Scheffersomyces amazonensis TaxID=1078765 RepID=UPI00315DC5C1